MNSRHTLIVVCFLATSVSACAKKLSPDELVTALSKSGATITKDGSYTNEPPAEMNMKLVVDGEEGFTAELFPTTKLASNYCQTREACFTVDYWTVETSDLHSSHPTWTKLLAAVGKSEAGAR